MATTTLEGMGWLPYWDDQGKYPISEGEEFNLSPGETKSIFYHAKPTQEADGHFYGNAFWILGDLPGLMGGIYSFTDVSVDASILGSGFIGRVEEFSLWDRALTDAEILNYHTNQTGMIGSGAGDKYVDIDTALADGLTTYFDYGEASILLRYGDTNTISLKNRSFPTVAGKNGNASYMESEDSITLQSIVADLNYSVNLRFMIEENGDFVLLDLPRTTKISFDEINSVFNVEMYPPVGETVKLSIEAVNLPNFKWHDLCFTYDGARMRSYLNGELLESNSYSDGVIPKQEMKLDMTNIEWASISSARGLGMGSASLLPYRPVVYDYLINELYKTKTLLNQSANINLFIDAKNKTRAASTFMYDRTSNPIVIDDVTKEYSFSLSPWHRRTGVYTELNTGMTYSGTLSNSDLLGTYTYDGSQIRSNYFQHPSCQNFFMPGIPIELIIKGSSNFTEEFRGVPLVTLPYGAKILIEKTRMEASFTTPEAHANQSIDSGVYDRYYSSASTAVYATIGKLPEGIESILVEINTRYRYTTKITERIVTPWIIREGTILKIRREFMSSYTIYYNGEYKSYFVTTKNGTVTPGANIEGRLSSKLWVGPKL
ncbi:hypothetical protein JHD46_07845 [Sulfurimonas sp. SAG-AH-194-C20]|nr:hypothetical protein [Sulfurimonas sp. SAG-AH-194-C20]MDF1879545.1 hypothetical protein [Sulfurimonas sp. SAG-AH-194-C20]